MMKHKLAPVFAGLIAGALAMSAWAADAPASASKAKDEAAIRQLFVSLMKAVEKEDSKAVASHYAPEGFTYLDVSTPRAFYGQAGAIWTWDAYFSLVEKGTIKAQATELKVTVAGDGVYAFASHFDHYVAKLKDPKLKHVEDITNRATSFLQKINGKWYIVLEHNSFPIDLITQKVDWHSKDVRELPKQ